MNHSSHMSDSEVLAATASAARDARRTTVDLLALLAEVDARRLHLGEGCSSLFAYCTQVLHLSEHAAYHRIEAARAARQYPVILELLTKGDVTLTTVAMLRPHLTAENHQALLEAARDKSKREVEHQIACLAPKEDAKTIVRRLPDRPAMAGRAMNPAIASPTVAGVGSSAPVLVPPAEPSHVAAPIAAAAPRPTVTPLAADRYLLRVTLSASAHATLRRAQGLLRHQIPNGDPAAILEQALDLLVEQLERAKTAKTSKPRRTPRTRRAPAGGVATTAASRHIPAPVKRGVWSRDAGRCAFVGRHGRCTETGHLEYHHVVPFARGGSTDLGNIALRCRAHNMYEAERAGLALWRGQAARSGPSSGPGIFQYQNFSIHLPAPSPSNLRDAMPVDRDCRR